MKLNPDTCSECTYAMLKDPRGKIAGWTWAPCFDGLLHWVNAVTLDIVCQDCPHGFTRQTGGHVNDCPVCDMEMEDAK